MKFLFTFFWSLFGLGLYAQCEYSENFSSYENNDLPDNWTVINTTGAGGSGVKVQSNTSAPSPDKYVRIDNFSGITGELIAILPQNANTSDGNHRLKFYLQGSPNTPSTLEVGTVNTNDETATFTLITAINDYPSGATWSEYIVNIPAGTDEYIAFKHSLTTSFDFLSFDDICFEEIPTCLEISDIEATDLGSDYITFEWSASDSGEDAWEYIVQETGTPAPGTTTNGTEATDTTVTVNELVSDTTYDIYVRAKCSDTDFGAWEELVKVTTHCSAFSANFASGFEDNVNAQEVKPCWSVYDNANGDLKTFGTSYNITPSEGALQLRFFFQPTTPNNDLVLISPQFSDLSTDKQVSFKLNKRANTEADFVIEVGTVASPTDMESFTLLDNTSINQTSVVASTWTEFTIPFLNYDETLNHEYIAFRAQHSGTGAIQYIFMDEFSYEYNLDAVLNDEPETAKEIFASEDYNCENGKTGTFEGATRSEETPCTAAPYNTYVDLWYKFTVPEDGRYAFSLNIPGIHGNLFLWTGTPGNLTQLPSGCATRHTAHDLIAGDEYYISIGIGDPSLDFNLCIQKVTEPGNDEPINAVELLESTTNSCENTLEGNTALATHSDDSECTPGYKDVWYTFTPSQTAEYTFRRTFLNGGAPTGITIYSGTPGNLTRIDNYGSCSNQIVLIDLVADETYYIAVSSSSSSNPVYFSLCAYPSPSAPDNDACDMAEELTVGNTFEENMIIADNTSATTDQANTPEPTCGRLEFWEDSRDIWFTFTVPESGNFMIETRGIDGSLIYDTAFETYTGTCGQTTLEPFHYNLPAPNVGQAHCNDELEPLSDEFAGARYTNKEPGQQVYIRVWGWSWQFGQFYISVYDDTDTCESPTNITLDNLQANSATLSWDEPTNIPANGYSYILQPDGTGYPEANGGTTTLENSVTFDDLENETTYEFYVRSLCDTNNSAWEGPFTFTTSDLSIEDIDFAQLKMYPNPAKDFVQITNTTVIENISIYDINGKLILTKEVNNTEFSIDMSNLSTGLYSIQMKTKDAITTKKIMKE